MKVGAISREAVLKALEECDRMGREPFLESYGYGAARSYVLRHEGKAYDSKAIAGVAHKYEYGRALRSDEFSGGREHAAAWLKRAGFTVTAVRNPDWTRDELILACALVMENGWKGMDAGDARVKGLSEILRYLPIHDEMTRTETFRNANGVARKTFDLATRHPDYQGKPTKGGALDAEVLQDFLDRPTEMMAATRLMLDAIESGFGQTSPLSDDDDLDEFSAPEGRLLLRMHLRRERNGDLRRRKIESVVRRNGRLACSVCDFDFERCYGERGAGYIECHHVVPLHVAGEGRTKLSDLALICSNCHRMIHRRAPWPTPAELRLLLRR